jgi:hypothetical protein
MRKGAGAMTAQDLHNRQRLISAGSHACKRR